MTPQLILVMTNVSETSTAHKIARQLIEQRLAACVNCLPAVQSLYRWQGEIEESTEITLLIKTTRISYAEVEATIKMLHPYQLPEIIAVPIVDGLPQYLGWIEQETKKDVDV